MDANDLRGQAMRGRLPVRQRLGDTADLQKAHALGPWEADLVDHEGHLRVTPDVPILRALAHVEPADVDRAELEVVREADRLHLGAAPWGHGRESPLLLAGEELLFGISECHGLHPMTSSNLEVKPLCPRFI